MSWVGGDPASREPPSLETGSCGYRRKEGIRLWARAFPLGHGFPLWGWTQGPRVPPALTLWDAVRRRTTLGSLKSGKSPRPACPV